MIVPGVGAAAAWTLAEGGDHCITASADTVATVSKAFFRDVSNCKILGKFPSWTFAAQVNRAPAISHILRPDFDAWNNTINAAVPIAPGPFGVFFGLSSEREPRV